MTSTRDLSTFPTIETLRRLSQSLAMLDAIIMREWDYGYYSFNSKWAEGEQMASMRNGQGDEWFCGFGLPGAFLKGFDHESKMSPWNMETPKVWPRSGRACWTTFLRISNPSPRNPHFQ